MASLGKKILSAFVDIQPDKEQVVPEPTQSASDLVAQAPQMAHATASRPAKEAQTDNRFAEYFDKLFREANIPGPDYYEFSAMIKALSTVPDEAARFNAAFAGLKVQGLDKDKLLSTAAEYLRILEADGNMFHSTVDAAIQEKVHEKQKEMEEKQARIHNLSKEIGDLQNTVLALESEIRDNQEKLDTRNNAYFSESAERKTRIQSDMEKIKTYLH